MTREWFEELVEEGVRRIAPRFRRYLKDVALVVEDLPSRTQRKTARVERSVLLFGLYEGTPRTARQYLPYRYPEKITLFQRSFEQWCRGDEECIREEVAHTVWHELAHALGIPEARVRALERRRRRR